MNPAERKGNQGYLEVTLDPTVPTFGEFLALWTVLHHVPVTVEWEDDCTPLFSLGCDGSIIMHNIDGEAAETLRDLFGDFPFVLKAEWTDWSDFETAVLFERAGYGEAE